MRRVIDRPSARRSSVLALAAVVVASAFLAGCASTGAGHSTAQRPTATPTLEQRVAALAQRAAGGSVQSVAATVDSAGARDTTLTLIATVGGAVPGTTAEIAAAQEHVKSLCFRMEQAVWTSGMPSGIMLGEVKAIVVGPIYDDYADLTTGTYGAADLKAAIAARLDWAHLSPDTAWDIYATWLRPAYRSTVLGQ